MNLFCPLNSRDMRLAIAATLLLLFSTSSLLASGSEGPERGTAIVPVPGVGELDVLVFEHWDVQVDDSENATTIRLINADRMNLQLTCTPRLKPQQPSEEELKSSVRQVAANYVDGSVEQQTLLKRLPTPFGNAILANFNDKRYQNQPPPAGTFSSITLGLFGNELMSIEVIILTQGPDTSEHDDALEVLNSLRIMNPEEE